MPTKALAIVFAGVSAMLPFASPWMASADEPTTADDSLALPEQPAGNETLVQQSGSTTPVNIVDAHNNIVQQQPNSIIIVPTAMTTTITKTGGIAIGNDNSSGSITSSASATVIRNSAAQ